MQIGAQVFGRIRILQFLKIQPVGPSSARNARNSTKKCRHNLHSLLYPPNRPSLPPIASTPATMPPKIPAHVFGYTLATIPGVMYGEFLLT